MKKLLYFIFASCLGTMIAGMALIAVMGVFIGAAAGSAGGGKSTTVSKNSVLYMDMASVVPEKTNNVPASSPLNFDFEQQKVVGLYDLTRTLEMAKDDDKIEGIYMNLSSVSMGNATASKVRDALIDFQESGKFIYTYADMYSQGAYYLASTADSVFVNPLGGVEFKGYAATIPFFKDMLDRLGVKMQIFYVGNFKSATEPYRFNEMSENNKLQVREYLKGLYDIFLADISESRNIPVGKLQEVADGYLLRNAKDAEEYGFVDKLVYKDQMIDILKEKLGVDEKKDIKTVSLADYSNKLKFDYKSKDKIAVVFAEGSIVDGDGEPGSIGGKKYSKLIRKIRKDEKVKAIVLRVNSGGGSAYASEEIWRELEVAKSQGIPVIASMGDVAASGGYYISAGADTILAEPNTITGSIGVFGMLPSAQKMLKEKLGVQFDTVKTAAMAQGITPFFDVSESEGEIIQEGVDEIYDIFLNRVSEGRSMHRDSVHNVAQGRVWTGQKALSLGLVDVMGGLDDAIAIAAEKAGLDKYKVAQYPTTKEPLQAFLDNLTGQESASASTKIKEEMIKEELGEHGFEVYQMMKEIKNMEGVQARMPFEVIIH